MTVSTADPDPARLRESAQRIIGPFKGHHHWTYATAPPPDVELGFGPEFSMVKLREPREGLLWFDRRCFRSDDELLRQLAGQGLRIPPVDTSTGIPLHGFIEGRTLGEHLGPEGRVPEEYTKQILEFVDRLTMVDPWSLNVERHCRRKRHAGNGRSARFLYSHIRFTERQVYRRQLPRFGPLFHLLGLPETALAPLLPRMRRMCSRPFRLLHGDLHRENLIVDTSGLLWTIDWELAMVGDPLYELATHLHLMGYPPDQEEQITLAWAAVVGRACKAATAGWLADLPVIRAYKRAQSVYTDIIRGAQRLHDADGASFDEELQRTAGTIHGALLRAADVLELSVPGVGAVEDACRALPSEALARPPAPRRLTPMSDADEPAHDPEVLELATKVFDLARQGQTDTLVAYVDAGVPPNLHNDKGDTLLMLAAYHGHPAAVAALLQHGADPDHPNDRGQTPLAGAVFKGEDEVVRILVRHGADPAAGNPSAVDTARMFGKTELLELFGSG